MSEKRTIAERDSVSGMDLASLRRKALNEAGYQPTSFEKAATYSPPIDMELRNKVSKMYLRAVGSELDYLCDVIHDARRLALYPYAAGMLKYLLSTYEYEEIGERKRMIADFVKTLFATRDDELFKLAPPAMLLDMINDDANRRDLAIYEYIASGKKRDIALSRHTIYAYGLINGFSQSDTGKILEIVQEKFPQAWLLLANLYKDARNVHYWNALGNFLEAYGLTPPAISDTHSDNVLDDFRFPETPQLQAETKISVIMSAYNSSATIGYAVNSILAQSHGNLELLVCDDGSDDDTVDILKKVGDPRIRLFRSTGNQGTYNIRNAMIPLADGDYITFQDSDDFAHPQRLEQQLNDFERRPDCKATMARWVRVREQGDFVFFRDNLTVRQSVVSLFAPTELFKSRKYLPLRVGADTHFVSDLLLEFGQNAVAHCPLPLIFGLWSDVSLTRSTTFEALECDFIGPRRQAVHDFVAIQRIIGSKYDLTSITDEIRGAGVMEPTGVEEISQ